MFDIVGQPADKADPARKALLERVMKYWSDPKIDLEEKMKSFWEKLKPQPTSEERRDSRPRYRV